MTCRWPIVCAVAACLFGVVTPIPPAGAQAPVAVQTPVGEISITADRMESPSANVVVATGNVELVRGTIRMLADRVDVNRDSGDVVGVGRVIFYDGEDRLTAERIDYNFKTGTGVVHNGRARSAPYYRISGERMERLDESHYVVRRGVFTTCDDDPPTWSFRFGYAEADLDALVYGTNASVWLKNLPIVPWFPILGAAVRRERQTGFLFPTFGSSSRKGNWIELPFYWAINDSQDLTLSLDYFSTRGVGLTGEYRYVLSQRAGGSMRAFGIYETEVPKNQLNTSGATTPSSSSSNTELRKPEARGWWGLQHNWSVAPGLALTADINGVSDDLVLREYSDSIYERSRPSVQSNVFLSWSRPSANFVGNLFWYQDLTTTHPVELQRLPDLRASVYRQPVPGVQNIPLLRGLTYELNSQFTNFVRSEGSEGLRLDLFPRLTLPVPLYFFTVTPFVAPRLTAYSTRVTGTHVNSDGLTIEETKDEAIARRSVDLGADFEMRASRVYNLGGFGNVDAILHSIEPRATYTWRDGSNLDPRRLPQWVQDTTPQSAAAAGGLSLANPQKWVESSNIVFSVVNRLRARTVAPEGTEPHRWELVRFTAGGSYDFRSPDRSAGPLLAELIVDPSRYFQFRANTSYSVYRGEGLQTANTDFTLTLPAVSASVGTRFSKPTPTATANSFLQGTFRADLSRYVSLNFSTNWDLRTDTFVENRFGFDVRFQCWAFDFAYIHRAKETGLNSADNEIRFALYLLGVGGPFGLGQRFSGVGGVAGK